MAPLFSPTGTPPSSLFTSCSKFAFVSPLKLRYDDVRHWGLLLALVGWFALLGLPLNLGPSRKYRVTSDLAPPFRGKPCSSNLATFRSTKFPKGHRVRVLFPGH